MCQSDNHQIPITKKSSFIEKLHNKIDVNELRNKRKSFKNADELFDEGEPFDDDEFFKSLEKLMILPPPPQILCGNPNPRTGFRNDQTYTPSPSPIPSPSPSPPPPLISVKHNTPQPPLNKYESNRKNFIRRRY